MAVRIVDTMQASTLHILVCVSSFIVLSSAIAPRGDTGDIRESSEIVIRTHKHRLTNKRELLVWSNHWRRAPLVRY
jgi:hypothetical protein